MEYLNPYRSIGSGSHLHRYFVVLAAILLLTGCSRSSVPVRDRELIETALPDQTTAIPAQPRRLLIFNKCEGYEHSSIPYITYAIEQMGVLTGAYTALISDDMAAFSRDSLELYDAILLNNTTDLAFEDPAMRENLLEFVRNGKGLIGIHAATDNFKDWPEGTALLGGLFDGHPWTADGTWRVKNDDPSHPLTAAFDSAGFSISDEIYRHIAPYSRQNLRVLLSLDMSDSLTQHVEDLRPADRDVGISWIRTFGLGRVFYCSLGHNHEVTWNPAILRHYLDGIQYALGDLQADATPSADVCLRYLATYEYGMNRDRLTELETILMVTYDSLQGLGALEDRLAAILTSDASLAAKEVVCRWLGHYGSEASVDVLAGLIAQPQTAQIAMLALAQIPGAAVDEVLRARLATTSGDIQLGIIETLGRRRDGIAVMDLSPLLEHSDIIIAQAAARALGRIANFEAEVVLFNALGSAEEAVQNAVLDAYLACADYELANGSTVQAVAIYQQLYASRVPLQIRQAALKGLVLAGPDQATPTLVTVLQSGDPRLEATAIALIKEIPADRSIDQIVATMPDRSINGKIQLLTVLAERGDPIHGLIAVRALSEDHPDVRLAALKALGALGDESVITVLATAAVSENSAESEVAYNSLVRLDAPGTNETIMALIPKSSSRLSIPLIRSCVDRHISDAVQILIAPGKTADSATRIEVFRALHELADPASLNDLVDVLLEADEDTERREGELMVAGVAKRLSNPAIQSQGVLQRLNAGLPSPAHSSLLRVLGLIGSADGLDAVRQDLNHQDIDIRGTALRVLADWPTPVPLNDLQRLARTREDETERVIALRGFIRIIGLDTESSSSEMLRRYESAMELATELAEQRLVFAGVGTIETLPALNMAIRYLQDPALRPEAEVAVGRIARAIYTTHPEEAHEAIQQVLDGTDNDNLKNTLERFLSAREPIS